jgi:hypothetical protein
MLVSETDDDSSNLSSITNVGPSLSGKASVCATEEQGSSPGVNRMNNEQGTWNNEQGTRNNEQGTRNNEQGILNREVKS